MRSMRPSSSVPSSSCNAAWANSLVVISTNAKPRERPVSRSMMIETLATSLPFAPKACLSVSSDVL
jgi:hypothetical protein